MQKYDGTTQTLDTTSGTTYSEPGSSVALPGVVNGENVAVSLDPSASTPTATRVIVFPERVSGRVTNVAGSTITLSNRRGTDTVLVSPDTKYYEKGTTPTGVSDGEQVTAFGLPDPTTPGALDAQIVAIFTPATPPQPQPQPAPTPTTAAAVTPGPQPGSPQARPAAPQAPAAAATGWHAPAPGATPLSHGSPGGPGNQRPGWHGGTAGGSGGQGFGHR